MSYFLDVSSRRKHEAMPGVFLRTFWGDLMTAAIVDLEPNAVVPMHEHPNEQVGLVLEGSLSFTIAGETRLVGPGDMYLIPGDVPHSATASDGGGRVIELFAPVRPEYQFSD
jgi:quercetin dioxygenase-like cupin family protein